MSLYSVQKLLYQLNRDAGVRKRFDAERAALLDEYELSGEERTAIESGDIGLLYVMGVNGQILMHYAALLGQPWDVYINAMREGVRKHGPVRAGLYSMLKDRRRMSLVFAGVCSHAPGITGRAARADASVRDAFYAKLDELRVRLEAAKPDALIVVAAEHFANFFMNNMPAYCMGMADAYEGPIEDEAWLAIKRRRVPGNADLSRRIIETVLDDVDVAYAEEWKFDHGIMVPLHFLTPRYDLPVIPVNVNCQGPPLTPLERAYEFGRALRRACDAQPERIALRRHRRHLALARDARLRHDQRSLGSRVPRRFLANDRAALVSYSDEETLRDAGQGGFEIRTFLTVAGATEGATGELLFYAPIPIFAVGCTVATMTVE